MEFGDNLVLLGISWYVVFLFSLTAHEAAHAWAALRLGDPTAYHGGQVTLNPAPHVQREFFGTVIMPVLSFVFSQGGWMMGWASAPYDPQWAYRYPKRAALMALAGPLTNLAIACGAAVVMRLSMAMDLLRIPSDSWSFTALVEAADPAAQPWATGLAVVLSIAFSLNVLLFLFNLLPVPPLDGSAVLQLFLPEDVGRRYQEFMAQPMLSLVGLLAAWRVFGEIFPPIYWFLVLHGLYFGIF
jgi:Zn-dependent protease